MTYFIIERPRSLKMTSKQNALEDVLFQQQKTSRLSRAVFLDRDGTINVERGYITDPSQIKLYPDTGKTLQALNSMGFLTVVISNQSAIGQGLMTITRFEEINDALWKLLQDANTYYDVLYYCPHTPLDKCECRKPKPGLILQAALDFNIDLSASYMVGDKLSDIKAGKVCGCKTILVKTGKGKEITVDKPDIHPHPDSIQENLTGVLSWILNNQST